VIRRGLLTVILGLVSVLSVPGAAARAETVVSLTFDDGIASQFQQARPALIQHGMLGTFFINSGNVGKPGPYYMSWGDVDRLNAERNEIGGHTIDHVRLSGTGAVPPIEARRQICVDATNLRVHGYQIIDFAYPYGAGSTNATVRQALQECGFVAARRYGDLRGPDCTASDCPPAENIPPDDPYGINSTGAQAGPLTLRTLQSWVEQAEDEGGGWVPIVFHEIDNSGQHDTVSPSTFAAFLDWLQPRVGIGTVVKTVRSVMGFPDPPLPVPKPQPVTAFAAAVTADRTTAFASLKVRSRQHLRNLRVSAAMAEPGTLSAHGTVTLGKRYRLKKVKADAIPGQLVTLRPVLTEKGLGAVKRALHRHRVVQAVITVVARDAAGNVQSATRTITLRL
jgi:peptidoglycan/xylan/chitin deacetylase (PgdA/CDA1 family)